VEGNAAAFPCFPPGNSAGLIFLVKYCDRAVIVKGGAGNRDRAIYSKYSNNNIII
jgi:hypothetical protein